jgi:hypothetical protein
MAQLACGLRTARVHPDIPGRGTTRGSRMGGVNMAPGMRMERHPSRALTNCSDPHRSGEPGTRHITPCPRVQSDGRGDISVGVCM